MNKRKTTQYSDSYARHPEIRRSRTRGEAGEGGGGIGTLELMFQDPSPPPLPPPPEFINNRRVYKHMGVYKHTSLTSTSSPQHIKSHQMKRCIGQFLYMHIEGINEYTYHITHQQVNRKCDCGRARTLPYTVNQSYAITINS